MKIVIVIALLAALIGGGIMMLGDGGEPAPEFRSSPIDTGPIIATASATGNVEAILLVQVGSQVSGTIETIHVDFNSRVTKGQVICELDTKTLQARVEQDGANLIKARAQVERVEANLAAAASEWSRAQTLVKSNSISESEFDRRKADFAGVTAEVKVAEAEVMQVQAALRLSEANLGFATIRSPVDGVVIRRSVDVGQTVAASFQAPILFEIAQQLNRVHILASVGEADIGRIHEGQTVSFEVDAYPDETFEGVVKQRRLASVIEQNVVTYPVVVEAANEDERLMPGMTANMEFVTDQCGPNSLRVLNAALRFTPDLQWLPSDFEVPELNGPHQRLVWVRHGALLKAVTVTTGITDGLYTQLIDGELTTESTVVTGIVDTNAPDAVSPFSMGRSRRKKK